MGKAFGSIRAASCDARTHQESTRHNGAQMTTIVAMLVKYLLPSHFEREPDWVHASRLVFSSISRATALTPRINPNKGAKIVPTIVARSSLCAPALYTLACRALQKLMSPLVLPSLPLHGAARYWFHNDCSCWPVIVS